MLLTPEPCLHAAHRGPHDQARMLDPQALSQEAILRLDHVVIAIPRESSVQPVTGFAGLSVSERVGQHYEVPCRIQRLAGTKQLTRKFGSDETAATATGAVNDQHCVA